MNFKYLIIALIAILFECCSAKKFNISQTNLANCVVYTIPPKEYGYSDFFQVNSMKNFVTKDNERLHMKMYVMTQRDAHILLTEKRYSKWENGKSNPDRVYEIVIEGWENINSAIRIRNWEIVKNAPGSHLLSPFDAMPVEIIQTNDGVLTVNIPGFAEPYLSYLDTNPLNIQFFSFGTYAKVSAKWFYDCQLDEFSPQVNDDDVIELKNKNTQLMDQLENLQNKINHQTAESNRCLKSPGQKTPVGNMGSGSCYTPDSLPGQCVHLEQCQHLYNIWQDKSRSKADSTFLLSSQCASNHGQVLVCCTETQNTPAKLPQPGICGRNKRSYKIFGGTNTYVDEFPWMALLEYTTKDASDEREYNCGGSLISDRYVLTAAHCVTNLSRGLTVKSVRLGEWDIRKDPDCETDIKNITYCADRHVDVPIEKIIIHPEFQIIRSSKNDIALIRLSRSVEYTDFISPICLPLSDHLKRSTFDEHRLEISGWGKTKHQSQKGNNIKQKANVEVVPFSKCQMSYGGIVSSQMCTFGKDGAAIATCLGDSGGPLFGIDLSNKTLPYYFIAGIVSQGSSYCGSLDVPDVYTKVNNFTDWVQENIIIH